MFSDQDVVSCCEYLDGLFPEIPVFDINVNKEVDMGVQEDDNESGMEQQQHPYVLALKEGKYYIGVS